MLHLDVKILFLFTSLQLLFNPSTSIRFRSSGHCLQLKQFQPKRDIDLSQFNAVTWDIKFHLSSKRPPSNPYFNIFFPENDLSCLTIRSQFLKTKGSFDLSCNDVECKIASFTYNISNNGQLLLNAYYDNKGCNLNDITFGHINIIDVDPSKYMLLYGCYFVKKHKIEGGYLLARSGLNMSQTFYKKLLRPLMFIANYKDLVVSDVENMSSCNCTSDCSYYDSGAACAKHDTTQECYYPYYLFGAIGPLVFIIFVFGVHLFVHHQSPNKDD